MRQPGQSTPQTAAAATSPTLPQDAPSIDPTPSPTDPDAAALAAILAALGPTERRAVVAHVRALVGMSKAKRAALMTLTT